MDRASDRARQHDRPNPHPDEAREAAEALQRSLDSRW